MAKLIRLAVSVLSWSIEVRLDEKLTVSSRNSLSKASAWVLTVLMTLLILLRGLLKKEAVLLEISWVLLVRSWVELVTDELT